MSATWMTCATLSTLSRPSMCHHRAVFVAGLSKPALLRQLLPSRAFSSKLPRSVRSLAVRQGGYPPQVATLAAGVRQNPRGICWTILFRHRIEILPGPFPCQVLHSGGPATFGRRVSTLPAQCVIMTQE